MFNMTLLPLAFTLVVGIQAQTPSTSTPAQSKDGNKVKSAEHALAEQKYEKALKLYTKTLNHRHAILVEVDTLEQQEHTATNMDRRASLLAQARILGDQLNATRSERELLSVQLEHVDDCVKTYYGTIDKNISDLTVREAELVKSCQSLKLYPPEK
jgi:hypothetical protein